MPYPKDHNSDSHSSSSHCRKSCTSSCPPKCNVECCGSLCASEICCRFQSAVVRVHTQTVLTTIAPDHNDCKSKPPAPAFDWSTQATANQAALYETHGNGFLIKDHCIVVPASLVQVPPDVLAQTWRWPYVSNNGSHRAGNGIPNSITQVSRILVDIFDVNGKGHAYTYEAYVCGIDGAGNTAVLGIDLENSDWNCWLPCIESCHPYFRWSRSRKSKCGDPVFLLGAHSLREGAAGTLSFSENLVSQGILTDNKSLDYTGWMQHEIIRTTLLATNSARGSPILNNCGAVIGMHVASEDFVPLTFEQQEQGQSNSSVSGLSYVVGVSEFFMRRPLKAFLQGVKKCKYGKHLGHVKDQIGDFDYYIKGYAGLAWTNVTGDDFDHFFGADGTKVPLYNDHGCLVDVKCTENVGIRVVTVAQSEAPQTFDISKPTQPKCHTAQDPTFAFLPYFDSQLPAVYPNFFVPDSGTGDIEASPFACEVFPNDIVYAIAKCRSKKGKLKKKCKFGDLYHQVAPALFTWKCCPGDQVYVQVRDYRYYWCEYNLIQGCLADYPLLLDYAWYDRGSFPQLGAPLPAGTVLPGFRPAF